MEGAELVDPLRQLLTAHPGKSLILYPHEGSFYRDMVYTHDTLLLASAESGRPPALRLRATNGAEGC